MTKLNIASLFSSAALALALVSPAAATTVTIGGTSISGSGVQSSVASATTITFDNYMMPASFQTSGTPTHTIVAGDQSGQHLAPTGDSSAYVTTGTGSITDTLSNANYFGFYWGSLDSYNTFSITQTNGSTLTLSGAQMASKYSICDDGNHSYFVNFFADKGQTFTSATFSSTVNAFEFDNVATTSATPEPGTVGMLAGGLLVMAGALRRRARAAKA